MKCVSKDKWSSRDGAKKVFIDIHKRDLLSFVIELYSDFNRLAKRCRVNNESIKKFRNCFKSQISGFNFDDANEFRNVLWN